MMSNTMERSEVSAHEVKVYQAFISHAESWLSNREIAGLVPDVAYRTISKHTQRLVSLGLLEHAEVFPAHKYKWAKTADKRNRAYLLRLEKAAEILGS